MLGAQRAVWRLMDDIDPPMDERRSMELFGQVMAKLADQRRRRAHWHRLLRALGAVGAALTGAQALRLLTR